MKGILKGLIGLGTLLLGLALWIAGSVFEGLVRGLGGYACDPTSDERCELDQKKFRRAVDGGESVQEALDEQIYPMCQFWMYWMV